MVRISLLAARGTARRAMLAGLLLLVAALLPGPAAAQYATGATLDSDHYASVPKTAPLSRGSYGSVPASYSLKRYTPTPGDQGRQGSCVGWAVGYAARTLAEAHRLSVDRRQQINGQRFSPSFIYNQINGGDCSGGSRISDALSLLEVKGAALLSDFPYDDSKCLALPSRADLQRAADYRIKGFKRLFLPDSTAKHVAVRRSLAEGRPVVIGMRVPDSFARAGALYAPTERDIEQAFDGTPRGHAMTVIGYDDNKHGGAFEIINSWGTDWGDRGFVWIKYDDFARLVREGYEMIPPDPPRQPAAVDMGGSIRFQHISGRDLEMRRKPGDQSFRLAEPQPSGSRFRVEATAEHSGFVYVLGGDETGKFVELFPRDRGVSPHLGAGATLLLPGPTEEYFTQLNETTGTDYYMVLFSSTPLEAAVIVERLGGAGKADIWSRIRSALGEQLVPADAVELKGGGGANRPAAFSAASDGVPAVAMVVEIEHVDASSGAKESDPPLITVVEPALDELEAAIGDDPLFRVSGPVFRLAGVAQDESPIQHFAVAGATTSRFSSRGPFEAEVEIPDDGAVHPLTISATDALGNVSSRTIRVMVTP